MTAISHKYPGNINNVFVLRKYSSSMRQLHALIGFSVIKVYESWHFDITRVSLNTGQSGWSKSIKCKGISINMRDMMH